MDIQKTFFLYLIKVKTTINQYFIYLVLLAFSFGFSQKNIQIKTIDSLLLKAQSVSKTNLDSAYHYAFEAYQKSISSTNDEVKSKATYHLSSYLIQQKKLDSAQKLIHNVLKPTQQLPSTTLGNLNANLGAITYLKEAYDEALEYYLKSINHYSESRNKKGLAKSYLQIGVIYEKRQQMDVANHFYSLSLKNTDTSKTHGTETIASDISFEKKIEMSQKMLTDISKHDNPQISIHYTL